MHNLTHYLLHNNVSHRNEHRTIFDGLVILGLNASLFFFLNLGPKVRLSLMANRCLIGRQACGRYPSRDERYMATRQPAPPKILPH